MGICSRPSDWGGRWGDRCWHDHVQSVILALLLVLALALALPGVNHSSGSRWLVVMQQMVLLELPLESVLQVA